MITVDIFQASLSMCSKKDSSDTSRYQKAVACGMCATGGERGCREGAELRRPAQSAPHAADLISYPVNRGQPGKRLGANNGSAPAGQPKLIRPPWWVAMFCREGQKAENNVKYQGEEGLNQESLVLFTCVKCVRNLAKRFAGRQADRKKSISNEKKMEKGLISRTFMVTRK